MRRLRGSILETTEQDEAGTIFTRTINEYTAVSLAGGARYAYKSSERVEHVEGTQLSVAKTTLTEWKQDQYTNVIAERRWNEVVADDKLANNDETITLRTFANNASD
jgi:hypothetical protein